MSMLDDFVEHTSGPSVGHSSAAYRNQPSAIAGTGIDAVGYEGFEEDGDDEGEQDAHMVQALETGFIPSARSQSLPPLFSLSLVQYSPPSSILHLTSVNNILFLASAPLSVIIIDLEKPDELVTIDLPKAAPEKGSQQKESPVINKLFADPTARHLIVTINTGDAFYLPISPGNAAVQSRRPRPLRIRHTISAVGWSPIPVSSHEGYPQAKGDAVTPPATDVLLGTTTGQILSLPLPPQDDIFKNVSIGRGQPTEKDLQTVYTLPDERAVTGLGFGFWPSGAQAQKASRTGAKRGWVVITTKERLYEVQGNVTTTAAGGKSGGWAEEVFKPIRETTPRFQELPGDVPNPVLRAYIPSEEQQSANNLPPASDVAWLTSPGLYTSSLSEGPANEILNRPSLLPYPASEEEPAGFSRHITPSAAVPAVPIDVAITRWHWLLLYPDQVVAISRENEKLVWEERLPLSVGEKAIGLSADPVSQTFWISTNKSILEILVRNEDRDVWRAKLDKGEFDKALTFAHTTLQKDIILSRQGDALFFQERFIQSAQSFAASNRSFEYVALKFIDAEERDGLRVFLSERLNRLDKKSRTQRMMLATWLVEIYLAKWNTLEDRLAAESASEDVQNLKAEKKIIEEELRQFMTSYQNDLEPKVVYELIESHGRTDLYLFYANLEKDHGQIVEYYVTEEKWLKAIDVLSRQTSIDLYYRFASILMRHAPRETVDSWIRQPSLSPRRLIPALLQQHQRSEPISANHAVRYLSHAIHHQGCTDTTIYNLLLTLYASDPDADDAPLLRFLSSCPDDPETEKPYYDLDYALRTCKLHNRIHACVLIYSKLGLYESSVDLALEKGDLELAKENADKPEDDEALRKKLWLRVARYVVQEQKDIKSAMRFLESTDLLKIEDILPFFPDFVVIDDFKTEICSALEDYSAHIDSLKSEMDDATASAESIKRDIDALAKRFVTVEQGDKCWKCGLELVSRQFYVFPCQHTFHGDCLISMAMENLPSPSLRRLLHLQDELVSRTETTSGRQLLSSNFSPAATGGANTPRRKDSAAANVTSDLLGSTLAGRNKLMAAGDKLRELIIPDALASAVSAVGAGVGVGGGGEKGGAGKKVKKRDAIDEVRVEELRKELDDLVAGSCPLCEGAVLALDKPFILDGEDTSDWDF
ncbi:hypothetical protein L202_05330 [Cryptococcus amylolentus CBS 6039]|uniref:Uncharacterized protein n=2 Tax=Cryptococcus amylolentus TaxID=104669 RepID=A0A1E3HLW4_9TREE|nr:hypothetical protein L202_05330 [Cryptococcus amylolentus CBS 6039]ODN76696.1 hypothetical protein L202_05330 [Cryptococcus amylolentus CBS 6039]ODO04652.1 hypothetical protein I350_05261 [Cryptococcus amylolentus CBS 6273]